MSKVKEISKLIKIERVFFRNGNKGLVIYIKNYSSDKWTKYYISELEFSEMYRILHSKR